MKKLAGLLIGGFIGGAYGYITFMIKASEMSDVAFALSAITAIVAPDTILRAILGGFLGLIIGWFFDRRALKKARKES